MWFIKLNFLYVILLLAFHINTDAVKLSQRHVLIQEKVPPNEPYNPVMADHVVILNSSYKTSPVPSTHTSNTPFQGYIPSVEETSLGGKRRNLLDSVDSSSSSPEHCAHYTELTDAADGTNVFGVGRPASYASYDNNITCTWYIAPSNVVGQDEPSLTLIFTFFQIEYNSDHVKVYHVNEDGSAGLFFSLFFFLFFSVY